MITFLILFAAAAVWVLSLIFKPFGRCLPCRGRGNIRRKGSRRAPKCRWCGGCGRRQRLGSRTVHRIRRQVAAHWRAPQ
jgi:hypothetical protein